MTNCRTENQAHFAVTIIGKDRPGIVAGTAEVLYRLGCNIEDSSCTMLGGEFATIYIVSHELPFSRDTLEEGFNAMCGAANLSAFIRQLDNDEVCYQKPAGELCLISVYGSDKPGIVYHVTKELAQRGVNIADLNTKLIGTPEAPVYVMMLEAVLPEGMSVEEADLLLGRLKQELNVEISVRLITPVAL